MKIALDSYYYALSGRKTAHTFAESALVLGGAGKQAMVWKTGVFGEIRGNIR